MKVLQLTTSFSFAGAEQIILDLCAMANHDFVIAALQPGDGRFKEKASDQSIPTIELNMTSKFDMAVISRLKKVIEEENIDLVHSHLVHANFIGRLAASSLGVPVISTIHIVEKRFRPSHTWMERLTASKAHKIVAVSDTVAQHMRDNIKLPKDKILTISNGIDTSRFHNTKQERDIDFLFLGRLDQQKGLDLILPGLKELSSHKPRISVVGVGPEENKLKSQATELGLELSWEGFVPHPEEWMNRSKICLVPSRWEGFGLVAAEALSCGCQVVHSAVDSLPQVCGPHGIALGDDQTKWSSLLLDAWQGFSEDEGRENWVKENYSKELMVKQYKELYNSCVA